jgi:hypothetical protein
MKRSASAVAIVVLLSFAIARDGIAAHDTSMKAAGYDRQSAGADIKLAMGPVSAPHKPGGPIAGSNNSPSGDTSGSSWHKKNKHRHKHPTNN